MDDRLLVLSNRLPPSAIRKFNEIARSFRLAWGADARLISTFDRESDALSCISGLESWTDVFEYGTYCDLWTSAYRRTDDAIAALQPNAATLLRNFYHEVAALVFRVVVTHRLLETAASPLLLLSHSSSAVAYAGMSTAVRRLNRTFLPPLLTQAGIRKAHHMYKSTLHRWMSPRKQERSNGTGRTDRKISGDEVLVSIEESGKNIALTILREMGRRGLRPIVVTSCPDVVEAVHSLGLPAHNLAVHSLRLNAWKITSRRRQIATELSRVLRTCKSSSPEWIYFQEIRARLLEYVAAESNIAMILDRIHGSSRVASSLVVDETSPVATIVVAWARSRQIPSLGFNPILMGDRPDNKYFPAQVHMVYGDQIRSEMTRIGVPANTIHVVGTPTFDSALSRDPEEDRKTTAGGILRHWRGEKLIVVGTERMPQPLVELGPVLRTLSEMPDVHIALKVHPYDSQVFYEKFVAALPGGSRIEVIKDCDLHALLHAADLLICIMSNIIVPAGILGTPTLVCDFSGKRRPLDFVEEGLSFGCFSPDLIAPMVRKLLFDPAAAAEWERMRQNALPRFNGPNDGQSHRRVVDRVIASIGKA